MFSKIQPSFDPDMLLPSHSLPLPPFQNPALPLPDDHYENYSAFLSQTCEELTSDDHVLYLVKKSFDHCLEQLSTEELQALTEKEDMYLNFVIYCTFKSCNLCDPEEFEKHREELQEHYDATDDEVLFLAKIENIVEEALLDQTSPFELLKSHSSTFSNAVTAKLTDQLKFMIGHSLTYLMEPRQILGLCLKWTLNHYQITKASIHTLVEEYIDTNSSDIKEKLEHIKSLMDEIMNMSS